MGIMSHIENRQHPRFPLRMPVLWESPAVRGYQKIGLTQNVSQGGLLLEVPQVLAPGTSTGLRASSHKMYLCGNLEKWPENKQTMS